MYIQPTHTLDRVHDGQVGGCERLGGHDNKLLRGLGDLGAGEGDVVPSRNSFPHRKHAVVYTELRREMRNAVCAGAIYTMESVNSTCTSIRKSGK